MDFHLLDLESVLEIHDMEVRERGTPAGVRDLGALEGALGRLDAHIYYDPDVRLEVLAAALAHGIVSSHPFIDGNKRTSFTAALVFLAANGHTLQASQAEKIDTWLSLAAGALSEAELVGWISVHLTPLNP
jgi:death-on-curing protein